MTDINKTTFDAYVTAVNNIKSEINEKNIEALKTAATNLSDILTEEKVNDDIKINIQLINTLTTESEKTLIDGLKSDFEMNSLDFKPIVDSNDNGESKSVTGVDVKQLDNAISNYDVLNGKIAYKATTPNGEYIVFKGTKEDFQLLKGGKKSRKTKTHRQKKVHRSTQKRNGRKRTNHRRK